MLPKAFFSKRSIFVLLGVLSLFCFSSAVCAQNISLGSVSNNLLGPFSGVSRLLMVASYLMGGAFLAASIIRYFEYRRNPVQVRLSSVIFMFILGALLIGLPLIASLSASSKSVGQQQRYLPNAAVPSTPQ